MGSFKAGGVVRARLKTEDTKAKTAQTTRPLLMTEAASSVDCFSVIVRLLWGFPNVYADLKKE